MIREGFRAVLLANGPVDAAVAETNGKRRIYPLVMPQGERKPSLVYQRFGPPDSFHLEGADAIRETTFQLDAWALDPDAAARLIELAERALNGFSGLVEYGDNSPPTVADIRGIFRDRERDGYDQAAKLYRDGRDFRVLWCPGT